jgi:pimeloyl-ACP methyl ester carboxylesterase
MLSAAPLARLKIMKTLKFLAVALLLLLGVITLLLYEGDIPKGVVDAKYSNHASQFITLENDATIHYRDEGNRRHEAIMLVHGFGASLHAWMPWVELLQDEFRVITLDLPAHGLTGEIPNADYSTTGYIEIVDQLADHLKLDTFTLGGNSMGGGVAWQYVLQHPKRVTAMILIDATGPMDWHSGNEEEPLIFNLLSQPWFRAIAEKLDPYYLIAQATRSAYNYSPVADDSLIMRYYDLALRQGTRKAIILRSSLADRSFNDDQLSSLGLPTLILWGREDSLIDVSIANRFSEALPDSTLIIYDRVGHMPMEEIPQRSAMDVKQFMAGLNR